MGEPPSVHATRSTRSGARHSRLADSEVLTEEKGPTCGVTRIEQILADNHWIYRRGTDFADNLDVMGAKHRFIPPHCPWRNGEVERFHRARRPTPLPTGSHQPDGLEYV